MHFATIGVCLAAQGTPRAVTLLIDRGADVDSRIDGGPTPPELAKIRGRNDVVKILREHGAR